MSELIKFISTRDRAEASRGSAVGLSAAIFAGLAPDGGLYVPSELPKFQVIDFDECVTPADFAQVLLKPFFVGDPLLGELPGICARAFNFPIPCVPIDRETSLLELYHGPTLAFKDVGVRFLSECVALLPSRGSLRTVLVATSGDTGGAVAAAFHGKPGVSVVILYPLGRISGRQEKQLTSWGGNVKALAVRGDFDDCQRLVKMALSDVDWVKKREFLSANSINLVRLLPQASYYARAAIETFKRLGVRPGFVIPSGNLGNAMAAIWARAMGLPIGPIVIATNDNRSIPDYLQSGIWKAHPTQTTLANAMDVGNPSNMERFRNFYPNLANLGEDVKALSVTDAEIREEMANALIRWGVVLCPHTATASRARTKLGSGHWIIVATAHPAKFETIVEPVIGALRPDLCPLEVPGSLESILTRKSNFEEIEPNLSELRKRIL